MWIYCDCCVSTLSFIQRMLFMGVGYCADLGFRFDYPVKRRMPEWGTSRKQHITKIQSHSSGAV